MTKEDQRVIRDHIVAIEQLYRKYLESDYIHRVEKGIEVSQAPLFTTTEGETTSIYQAYAVGENVYLNTHVDRDFTISAVSVMCKTCTDAKKILAYFCFPTLGVVVPLRQFDVLFFDPTTPHNVSSRCRNDDNILCLSLYLKANIIGGNDNSLPLTDKQEELYKQYVLDHGGKV